MRVVLVLVVLLVIVVSVADAATHPCAPAAQPFTAASHYMSLGGDLRLRVHQNTGTWWTNAEVKECYMLQPIYPVNGWKPSDLGASFVSVGELVPFTEATNYMSVAGYIQWQSHRESVK
jgi:hypothetical protein